MKLTYLEPSPLFPLSKTENPEHNNKISLKQKTTCISPPFYKWESWGSVSTDVTSCFNSCPWPSVSCINLVRTHPTFLAVVWATKILNSMSFGFYSNKVILCFLSIQLSLLPCPIHLFSVFRMSFSSWYIWGSYTLKQTKTIYMSFLVWSLL